MVEGLLFPLRSVNAPTKLLSFAAIHWASSGFLVTRLFRSEHVQVSGISMESQVAVLHYHRDFGVLLFSLSWALLLSVAKIPCLITNPLRVQLCLTSIWTCGTPLADC